MKKKLSFALLKCGCSRSLALAIALTINLLTGDYYNSMNAETSSSSSIAIPVPEEQWKKDLKLPEFFPAPDALKSHARSQLRLLFNIGRERSLSEETFRLYIEPLALDETSVKFAHKLLKRIDHLCSELSRGGRKPITLPFKTQEDKDKLYSYIWEKEDRWPTIP